MVVFIVSVLGQLVEMERSGLDSEEFLEKLRQSTLKLREMEHNLLAAKKDVANYQEMLEQSQVSCVVGLGDTNNAFLWWQMVHSCRDVKMYVVLINAIFRKCTVVSLEYWSVFHTNE